MTNRVCGIAMVALALGGTALAQDEDLPLNNWTAPPFWRATVITAKPGPDGQMLASEQGMTARAQSLPSSPLPFVAITPCRIVDTRVNVADGFHEPNFSDNETRTFDLPNSPDCTGLPATTGAWSLNVQFRPIAQASYITLFPTGTTRPGVSTTVATPAGFTTDAAIVPAGTSGDIDVYCQYAGRVVIDINGYYASQSLVSSLNTKKGDVTLAAGSNIAITPSGQTLTIAMTGVPGGTLPAGSSGQTLYSNGSGWLASSALTNDGANIGVSGSVLMPATTSGGSAGVIWIGGQPFLHDYGPNSSSANTFLGLLAGNFTMGGVNSGDGSQNVGIGAYSLTFATTGYKNTAIGYRSLNSITTGHENVAAGFGSLGDSTTGYLDTAVGAYTLAANTAGYLNTAAGAYALNKNTTGNLNTASGYDSLASNTTGSSNTAVAANSLVQNTTGSNNIAVGEESLTDNTIASNNTAVGTLSMWQNTAANGNTAVGYTALEKQSFSNAGTPWDSLNTAIGSGALFNNQPTSTSNGIQNAAVGSNALYANTTGFDNTAVGANAGNRTDSITAYDGGTATFVPSTTGSYNTFVGHGAGATAQVDNCTAVGTDAYCDSTDQVRLGNYYVTSIGGKVAWSALSDVRAKTDIHDLDLGLDLIMKLRPVSYRLRNGNRKTDLGLVAQDVEKVLGDSYNVVDVGGDPDRTLSLRYTELIAPLVKAVQEQQATIRAQQRQIQALKAQRAEIEELRHQVQTLMAAREGVRPEEAIGN